MDNLGIFGGTFDPVHLGHMHLAQQVLTQVKLDKLLLIPCFKSAYKKKIFTTPTQRIDMLRLAIQGQKKIALDDREIHQKGISYTINTLLSLRKDYPNTTFHLIMGADAFSLLPTWHRWEEILQLTNLIIVERPDVIKTKSQSFTKDKNKIKFLEINPLPIAATKIRNLIQSGQSAEHLLPKRVWQYIIKNGLYNSAD